MFLWDGETRQPLQELQCHSDACRCVHAVADAVLTGAASRDATVVIFKAVDPLQAALLPQIHERTSSSTAKDDDPSIVTFDRYCLLPAWKKYILIFTFVCAGMDSSAYMSAPRMLLQTTSLF